MGWELAQFMPGKAKVKALPVEVDLCMTHICAILGSMQLTLVVMCVLAAKSKSKDEFKNLKQTIAANVRDVRQALKERDALLQKGASGTKETVQKSYKIREQIKQAKEDAQKLKALKEQAAGKGFGAGMKKSGKK